MKFVDNGVPKDFARLTFPGLKVPLCELSEEEYMWVVFGHPVPTKSAIALPVAEGNQQYFDSPIDILELSVRAEHCLQRAGIDTVGKLCQMTEWELSKLRNMGSKSLKEVKDKLEKNGCQLRENLVED